MTLALYGHPLSSYTWKPLIAMWENGTPFDYRSIAHDDPAGEDNGAALKAHWPPGKFPLLLDGERVIPESTPIIEYLDRHYPGPTRWIPDDPDAAFETRLLDRIFDTHVMAGLQAIVAEHIPFITAAPDPNRIARARGQLDAIYPWLDARLAGRDWAIGDAFTLADCAAAPSLYYADRVHPIPAALADLTDYKARLIARPSVARALDEARPYRAFFPLGDPEDD
jgi:glutathione S-transferase